jgi:triphosphoribosyl-dephospho-CoA synthase
LVDRRGPGAHKDLSLAIMRRSAFAIESYFREMALISATSSPGRRLRERLAAVGRNAERAMLDATGGSNAHKGAIWLLGLLASAAAMHSEGDTPVAEIAATARHIASFEDRAAPRLVSHGDMVAQRYGATGARGEALCGFPHVVDVGLPALRAARARGAAETVARLDALLRIMSQLEDTCLLYRGGEAALASAQQGAAAVVRAGGCGTTLGRECLRLLDRRLLRLNVSPGGSADLLAATLFLDAIERGQDEVQTESDDQEGTGGIY